MATQIPFFQELTTVVESLKSHRRYSLRTVAIVSILAGSVLNFACLLAAFIDSNYDNAPRYLTVWTSIVVCVAVSLMLRWWSLSDFNHYLTCLKSFRYLSFGVAQTWPRTRTVSSSRNTSSPPLSSFASMDWVFSATWRYLLEMES